MQQTNQSRPTTNEILDALLLLYDADRIGWLDPTNYQPGTIGHKFGLQARAQAADVLRRARKIGEVRDAT